MDKLKPALLASLPVILLSIIPIVNLCCFLWAIGGGALAAFLYFNWNKKITVSEGAKLGALTGVFAGAIAGALQIIISVVFGTMNQSLQELQGTGVSQAAMGGFGTLAYVIIFVVYFVVLIAFCTLGGVIGGAIWQNNQQPKKGPKKVN